MVRLLPLDASEVPLAATGDASRRAEALHDNQPAPDASRDVAQLRRTVEEQRRMIEALTARLELTTNSDADVRGILVERARKAETRLEEQVAQAAEQVAERDAIIRDLQRQVAEQTAWAQRAVADVLQRDSIIRDLQATLRRSQSSLPARLYRRARRVARWRPS